AFQMYNFWFANGVTPRGSSVIPILAFNFRDRVSTDVNSRVIEFLSLKEWVTLTNFPANTFSDGTAPIGYTLNPKNHRRITIDNSAKTMVITNLIRNTLVGATAPTIRTERYSINVREIISDYAAIVQLSEAPNAEFPAPASGTFELDQRYAYLEVPAGETAVATEQRTRDARIIFATVGAGNTIDAVKASATALQTEKEWNVAAKDFALNQLETSADGAGISEKAFRLQHSIVTNANLPEFAFYYTYSPATGSINPTNDTIAALNQWTPDNWLAFRPLIRRSNGTPGNPTTITNMELARSSVGGAENYNYTNVMKIMQADTPRTVLQLAGTTPNTPITAPETLSFSNLFMAVEYGTGINDRLAKVTFAGSRADVLTRLNAKTTYNYFQGGTATNSGSHEEVVNIAAVENRGIEWVTVSNTIHNSPTAATPGLTGQYAIPMDPANNIGDGDDYSKVRFDFNSSTNFILDPINKTVQELRIVTTAGVTRTNTFVYGYTVMESSFEPSLSPTNALGLPTAPNAIHQNRRYNLVLRLEGFGDYKNLFLAGEIGRFDASKADPVDTSNGAGGIAGVESERYKARLIFGTNITTAKAALKFMQTHRSWNFVTRVALTQRSPLLDSTETTRLGLFQLTGDSNVTIEPTNSGNFYDRLATATGAESNVIDTGNFTNLSFFRNSDEIPFVVISSIQSNVLAQVRYRIEVAQNFFADANPARRSNDVIFSLDSQGSPLNNKFIGIRRHDTEIGTLKGNVFSMFIGDSPAAVLAEMGDLNAGADELTKVLPITLRYTKDMTRVAGSANATVDSSGDLFIPLLTNTAAGIFASLDSERIYLPTSNSVWTYDNTTKLMTIRYTAPSVGGVAGSYLDPLSGTLKANNSTESYRVIPVLTLAKPEGSDLSKGRGVILLRSDETSGTPGFLHNKYLTIVYHGSRASGTIITGADFVYMAPADTLNEATNTVKTASTDAQFTVLAPYSALDLSPLNKFVSIRNPDDPASFPSTWALSSTDPGTTNNYQFDPSNTLLFKMTQENLDDRVIFVENVATPVNATGYTGATTRQTVRYRLDLTHAVPLAGSANIQNNSRQIGIKLIGGQYVTTGTPSGQPSTNPGTTPPDMFLVVRTARLTTPASPELDASWQAISDESLYIGYAPQGAQSSAGGTGAYNAFTNGAGNPVDPYGVAAYTGALPRAAINYYFRTIATDNLNFMTTAQNTIATNTYSTGTPGTGNVPQLFFRFNVGTGNGHAHGWGGLDNGVISMNVGFTSELIAGNNNPTSQTANGRLANFWIRPIRIVDADTFIFQLYNGQAVHASAGGAFVNYTSGTAKPINYTLEQLTSYVSNKYWIIRAGSGSELWRARITNGSTAAEALQNLGTLTSPNLAPDFGLNRRVLTNIANGIEYVGNADVNHLVKTVETPPTGLSAAEAEALYVNRIPRQLELDNFTNWVFSTDKTTPSVTV
ncbi:MAG: hypothetical protein ACRCY4_01040, partial [Brevinema sp.]